MRNFQGIVFIRTETCREIAKYISVPLNLKLGILS